MLARGDGSLCGSVCHHLEQSWSSAKLRNCAISCKINDFLGN